MQKQIFLLLCITGGTVLVQAQTKDSLSFNLEEIPIITYKTMNGIGRVNDNDGLVIYSGKKNEVLTIDTLDANKAINNTRQLIGRIPGVNIIETESGGFTANGIGFRGLNPYQSIETNTRQNGYNISADIFGYNEAYYLPPMEAVKNIVFLRGAAGLAYGPQIGGMINYELKDGAKKPFEVSMSQTAGSYGLFSDFTSVGGTIGKLKYYSFFKYRNFDGWRVNSKQEQISGFVGLKYQFNSKWQAGVEYTLFRNTIQMPGGLNDSLFNQNPRQSLRARNWLQSPWNLLSAFINYDVSKNTHIQIKSTYMNSDRNLVWRNEDVSPQTPDTINPATHAFEPRELGEQKFQNITNELRVLHQYQWLKSQQTIAGGVRYAYANLTKKHAADGTTGSDLDFTRTSDWGGYMNFYTTNIAAYLENSFNFNNKLIITPGVRYEYLSTIADGYDKNKAEDSEEKYIIANNFTSTRKFFLLGFAFQYNVNDHFNFYGNYNQSYRPLTYSNLTPFGTIARIDKNLKDISADNIDIGFRGTFKNILNFDFSVFYLNYKNRVGTIKKTQDTITYLFRTNTGSSENKGFESYVELNILQGLIPTNQFGRLSIYNSFAFVNAKYITGEYAGKYVEYAPQQIERIGLNYKYKKLSFNIQYSYTAKCYGDADNTVFDQSGLIGLIPSYQIIDFSSSFAINKNCKVNFGINNIANEKYFTLRTDEYPGPGIIPSIGRMIYAGISATF